MNPHTLSALLGLSHLPITEAERKQMAMGPVFFSIVYWMAQGDSRQAYSVIVKNVRKRCQDALKQMETLT